MGDKNRSSMRTLVITLITLTLSGFPGLMQSVFADPAEDTVPILRHQPPRLVHQGETMVIEALVENAGELASVMLWYRAKGGSRFNKIKMKFSERGRYEGRILVNSDLKNGIEYLIEVVDQSGRIAQDGSRALPYFAEVREASLAISFALGTENAESKKKKPFWQKTWFWVSVAALVGGGIATVAGNSGGGQDTGTVILE